MRIITWNCNMAFRKKADAILKQKPDILIVPECEHPERLLFPTKTKLPKDLTWIGNNPNKGLGIFSYSNYRFSVLDCHNPQLKTIVPIAITGGDMDFTLLAIWANHPADKGFEYVGQIWKALHHYESLLSGPVILTGDFNSNTIFDKPKRQGNHSTIVERLEKKGIHSCYHQHFKQEQGKEKHPTWYLYRHEDKRYHLDYCFASQDFKLKSVKIGKHADWCMYSDHVPLTATFAPA
jgi:exodeoxyribonuclease-3